LQKNNKGLRGAKVLFFTKWPWGDHYPALSGMAAAVAFFQYFQRVMDVPRGPARFSKQAIYADCLYRHRKRAFFFVDDYL